MKARRQVSIPVGLLHNRNFARMWSALLITETGSAITQVTSFLLVFRLTGSVFSTGLMMAATIMPSLLFGLVAGAAVDRADRRRIMVVSEIVRAVLIGAIPLLLPSGIIWLYILVMASSSLRQFFNPAYYSILPDIVGDEDLPAANSLLAASQYGAIAVGSVAAGLMVANWPIELAYYFDAATFLVSAVLLSRVRILSDYAPVKVTQSVLENVTTGLRFVAGKPALRYMFLALVPIGIAYGFSDVLRLPFVLDVLGGSDADYGLLESLTVVGMVLAGLLLTLYSRRLRDGQWVVASFIGVGLASIAFAFSPTIGIALVFAMFEGFMYAPEGIAASLIIERNTPRHMRGRAFSALFVVRDSMFMFGMVLAGIGDLFDLRLLYLISGIVVLVTGLVAYFLPGLGLPVDRWLSGQLLANKHSGVEVLASGRRLRAAEYGRLMGLVPSIAAFSQSIRSRIQTESLLFTVPLGTAIVRQDDNSNAVYFILEGSAIAMRDMGAGHEILEVLTEGDFFGEIAALTGSTRTADVVASEASAVVAVPSGLLLEMARESLFGRLVGDTVNVRLARLGGCDVALSETMYHVVLRALHDDRGSLETE